MNKLDAEIPPSAVHLCIDMQLMSAPDGPWPTPWLERVLPKVLALTQPHAARTVFTRFIPPHRADDMSGAWRRFYAKWRNVTRGELDERLLNLVPELHALVPPASVFDKMVYSAFANGVLHGHLRARDVDTLVVTGTETDVCILSTVMSAVDLGYRVVIARDAICSSTDETHDALLKLYHARFDTQIEIAEVGEIMEAWRP